MVYISLLAANREKYRKSYFCPIETCASTKALKKLSNHLIEVHGITNAARRQSLLAEARMRGAQPPKRKRVQITITESFLQSPYSAALPPATLIQPPVSSKTRGTRHYAHYDVQKDVLLFAFFTNLTSFDGGSKSPKEAKEIAIDVSKALAFADSHGAKWESLLK